MYVYALMTFPASHKLHSRAYSHTINCSLQITATKKVSKVKKFRSLGFDIANFGWLVIMKKHTTCTYANAKTRERYTIV